jgi:hypothetical protein
MLDRLYSLHGEGNYKPRIVGGHVMTQADLERVHKEILGFERIEAVSDEMRAVRRSPVVAATQHRGPHSGLGDAIPKPP